MPFMIEDQARRFTAITVLALTVLAMNLPACTPAADATWIDVRTAEEYAEAHVAQAIHIPHEEIEQGVATLDLEKDRTIYLYCGSGRRAGIARDALLAAGYTDVVNLGGLEDALARAGEAAAD